MHLLKRFRTASNTDALYSARSEVFKEALYARSPELKRRVLAARESRFLAERSRTSGEDWSFIGPPGPPEDIWAGPVALCPVAARASGKLPITFEQFEEYGMDRDAIAPALRELEALGLIEITERGCAGNALQGFRRRPIRRLA